MQHHLSSIKASLDSLEAHRRSYVSTVDQISEAYDRSFYDEEYMERGHVDCRLCGQTSHFTAKYKLTHCSPNECIIQLRNSLQHVKNKLIYEEFLFIRNGLGLQDLLYSFFSSNSTISEDLLTPLLSDLFSFSSSSLQPSLSSQLSSPFFSPAYPLSYDSAPSKLNNYSIIKSFDFFQLAAVDYFFGVVISRKDNVNVLKFSLKFLLSRPGLYSSFREFIDLGRFLTGLAINDFLDFYLFALKISLENLSSSNNLQSTESDVISLLSNFNMNILFEYSVSSFDFLTNLFFLSSLFSLLPEGISTHCVDVLSKVPLHLLVSFFSPPLIFETKFLNSGMSIIIMLMSSKYLYTHLAKLPISTLTSDVKARLLSVLLSSEDYSDFELENLKISPKLFTFKESKFVLSIIFQIISDMFRHHIVEESLIIELIELFIFAENGLLTAQDHIFSFISDLCSLSWSFSVKTIDLVLLNSQKLGDKFLLKFFTSIPAVLYKERDELQISQILSEFTRLVKKCHDFFPEVSVEKVLVSIVSGPRVIYQGLFFLFICNSLINFLLFLGRLAYNNLFKNKSQNFVFPKLDDVISPLISDLSSINLIPEFPSSSSLFSNLFKNSITLSHVPALVLYAFTTIQSNVESIIVSELIDGNLFKSCKKLGLLHLVGPLYSCFNTDSVPKDSWFCQCFPTSEHPLLLYHSIKLSTDLINYLGIVNSQRSLLNSSLLPVSCACLGNVEIFKSIFEFNNSLSRPLFSLEQINFDSLVLEDLISERNINSVLKFLFVLSFSIEKELNILNKFLKNNSEARNIHFWSNKNLSADQFSTLTKISTTFFQNLSILSSQNFIFKFSSLNSASNNLSKILTFIAVLISDLASTPLVFYTEFKNFIQNFISSSGSLITDQLLLNEIMDKISNPPSNFLTNYSINSFNLYKDLGCLLNFCVEHFLDIKHNPNPTLTLAASCSSSLESSSINLLPAIPKVQSLSINIPKLNKLIDEIEEKFNKINEIFIQISTLDEHFCTNILSKFYTIQKENLQQRRLCERCFSRSYTTVTISIEESTMDTSVQEIVISNRTECGRLYQELYEIIQNLAEIFTKVSISTETDHQILGYCFSKLLKIIITVNNSQLLKEFGGILLHIGTSFGPSYFISSQIFKDFVICLSHFSTFHLNSFAIKMIGFVDPKIVVENLPSCYHLLKNCSLEVLEILSQKFDLSIFLSTSSLESIIKLFLGALSFLPRGDQLSLLIFNSIISHFSNVLSKNFALIVIALFDFKSDLGFLRLSEMIESLNLSSSVVSNCFQIIFEYINDKLFDFSIISLNISLITLINSLINYCLIQNFRFDLFYTFATFELLLCPNSWNISPENFNCFDFVNKEDYYFTLISFFNLSLVADSELFCKMFTFFFNNLLTPGALIPNYFLENFIFKLDLTRYILSTEILSVWTLFSNFISPNYIIDGLISFSRNSDNLCFETSLICFKLIQNSLIKRMDCELVTKILGFSSEISFLIEVSEILDQTFFINSSFEIKCLLLLSLLSNENFSIIFDYLSSTQWSSYCNDILILIFRTLSNTVLTLAKNSQSILLVPSFFEIFTNKAIKFSEISSQILNANFSFIEICNLFLIPSIVSSKFNSALAYFLNNYILSINSNSNSNYFALVDYINFNYKSSIPKIIDQILTVCTSGAYNCCVEFALVLYSKISPKISPVLDSFLKFLKIALTSDTIEEYLSLLILTILRDSPMKNSLDNLIQEMGSLTSSNLNISNIYRIITLSICFLIGQQSFSSIRKREILGSVKVLQQDGGDLFNAFVESHCLFEVLFERYFGNNRLWKLFININRVEDITNESMETVEKEEKVVEEKVVEEKEVEQKIVEERDVEIHSKQLEPIVLPPPAINDVSTPVDDMDVAESEQDESEEEVVVVAPKRKKRQLVAA
ncbi:hypothetical protein RCL1_006488 [Eukaryota sp. TZLM3-RCL]